MACSCTVKCHCGVRVLVRLFHTGLCLAVTGSLLWKDTGKPELNDNGPYFYKGIATSRGFSYLSEVGARDLLNLGKKDLNHQNWEHLALSKRTEPP